MNANYGTWSLDFGKNNRLSTHEIAEDEKYFIINKQKKIDFSNLSKKCFQYF